MHQLSSSKGLGSIQQEDNMFKKKKPKTEYDINIYTKSGDNLYLHYDVHLDGKLIKTGKALSYYTAQMFAEHEANMHSKLGKYKYTV